MIPHFTTQQLTKIIMATKQELLTALETRYPREEGEKVGAYITRISERIQPGLDRRRARLQERMDEVPATVIELLKREALQILAEQAQVDYKEANKDSTLS